MPQLPAPSTPANPPSARPTSLAAPPPGTRTSDAEAPAAPGDAIVATRAVTRRFGDQEVIRPLDLDIAPGSILGLIGPSGCGKTTTVRLLTGLLTPSSGSATVFGRPSVELTAAERSRIGYLPQTPALFPELSLHENLSFHASMYGLPFRRGGRLDQLLDWVELTPHRSKRVADSSGGMQRRLALAAAFVHDPDVVFLDEPTAGIDPILRDKLWTRFRESAATGKTLVVTTQYVGEAGQCDTVGLLSEGELLLLDTPAALRRAAFDGAVVDVRLDRPISDQELDRLREHPVVLGVERTGPVGLRVVVEEVGGAMTPLHDAIAELGAEPVGMDEHVVEYDEAFVRIVERHRDGAGAVTDEPTGEPMGTVTR